MKPWIVETFKDSKWRLLAYPDQDGDYLYPVFPVRKEAQRWRKRRDMLPYRLRLRRAELPGVEG